MTDARLFALVLFASMAALVLFASMAALVVYDIAALILARRRDAKTAAFDRHVHTAPGLEPPLFAAVVADYPEVTRPSVVAEAEAVLRGIGGGERG
jgi:hypothetical protein